MRSNSEYMKLVIVGLKWSFLLGGNTHACYDSNYRTILFLLCCLPAWRFLNYSKSAVASHRQTKNQGHVCSFSIMRCSVELTRCPASSNIYLSCRRRTAVSRYWLRRLLIARVSTSKRPHHLPGSALAELQCCLVASLCHCLLVVVELEL